MTKNRINCFFLSSPIGAHWTPLGPHFSIFGLLTDVQDASITWISIILGAPFPISSIISFHISRSSQTRGPIGSKIRQKFKVIFLGFWTYYFVDVSCFTPIFNFLVM